MKIYYITFPKSSWYTWSNVIKMNLRNKSNSMIYLIKCHEKSKIENWVFFRGGGKLLCTKTFFYVQYEQTSWCAWKAASERTFFVFIVHWYLFSKKNCKRLKLWENAVFQFSGGGMSWVREIILVMSQAVEILSHFFENICPRSRAESWTWWSKSVKN